MTKDEKYDKLENALNGKEHLKFESWLSDKYGANFLMEVVKYFESDNRNVYSNDIDKNLDEIIEHIEGKDRNIGSSSVSRGNSSANDSHIQTPNKESANVDDSDEFKHIEGNNYSKEYALYILDKRIKEIEGDYNALKQAFEENNLRDRQLRQDMKENEFLLVTLRQEKKRIMRAESYDTSKKVFKGDESLKEQESKINEAQKQLDALNKLHNNTNKSAKLDYKINIKRSILEREIKHLKHKQGNMMAKQTKLIDERLNKLYGERGSKTTSARREAYKLVRDEHLDEVKSNIKKERKEALDGIKDGGIISSRVNSGKYWISYRKYDVVNKYCQLLKRKDGVIKGATQLSEEIKDAIYNSGVTVSRGVSRA